MSSKLDIQRSGLFFATMITGATLGYWIVISSIDYVVIISGLVFIIGLIIFVLGERGIRIGFIAWIWMFALGWRKLDVTSHLSLHPLVVFMLALFGLMAINVGILRRRSIPLPIPRLLRVFSLFWLWGWIPGLLNGFSIERMLQEFLNFILILPLFAVASYVLVERSYWKRSVLAFYIAGTLIAILGIVEYVFPEVQLFSPDLSQDPTRGYVTQDGYLRASFLFFGGQAAAIVCALSLPMLKPLWVWCRRFHLRFLLILALLSQLYAIYISGTRAAWLMVAIGFVLLCKLRKGWRGAVIGLVLLIGIFQLLPQVAETRLLTLVDFDEQGHPIDSSDYARLNRYTQAINLAVSHPAGVGWSGAGWVHSDFLQVTANLGILGGVLFIVWYAKTLKTAWQQALKETSDPLFSGLLISFVFAGVILIFEGAQVLTQYIIPVWFVWVMLDLRLRQIQSHKVEDMVTCDPQGLGRGNS